MLPIICVFHTDPTYTKDCRVYEHTPCTRLAPATHAADDLYPHHIDIYIYTHVYIRGQLCMWAEKHCICIVGMVDGHFIWCQEYTLGDACRPCILKPGFCQYLQLAQVPRSPDLAIFVVQQHYNLVCPLQKGDTGLDTTTIPLKHNFNTDWSKDNF